MATYELKTKLDSSHVWSAEETYVKGSLNVVAAALTELMKYPPHALISLELKRLDV